MVNILKRLHNFFIFFFSKQIKYLHAFQYNGFAFVVTVQPMITSNTKAVMKYVIFETRVARFCLDNKSMKSYTEIPIR